MVKIHALPLLDRGVTIQKDLSDISPWDWYQTSGKLSQSGCDDREDKSCPLLFPWQLLTPAMQVSIEGGFVDAGDEAIDVVEEQVDDRVCQGSG